MQYTIQRGDTLDAIATRFNVPGGYMALARLNNIPNPDLIRAGSVLTIPDPPQQQTSAPDSGGGYGMDDGLKTGLKVGGGLLALGVLAWWWS